MGRPAVKFVEPLSEADREYLNQVWRTHPVYTVRCRAHAILLSSQGFTVSDIQEIMNISKPTALAWINRWQESGRDGLEDAPRPGGPTILDEGEQELVEELLERFPREPRRVIDAIKRETGKIISFSTLGRLARKMGFRWKRFRRSMRKHCDERLFRLAKEEVEELRAMPDIEVAFFDEAGFSLQGVVPYGWQRTGERGELTVGKGRDSVQVVGIYEEDGESYGYLHRGSITGTTVAEVLEDYSQRISRPTVLILDNASVHTCGLVADQMDTWNDRGLYFYFLPPHSPELNDIEQLWKKLKYQKLPLDAWEHLSNMIKRLVELFHRMGHPILMPSLHH